MKTICINDTTIQEIPHDRDAVRFAYRLRCEHRRRNDLSVYVGLIRSAIRRTDYVQAETLLDQVERILER